MPLHVALWSRSVASLAGLRSRLPSIGGRLLLASIVFAACLSCTSAGEDAGDAGSSPLCNGWTEPGIAFAPNFAGFHSWSNAPALGPDGSTDGLHGAGPMRVYWNA